MIIGVNDRQKMSIDGKSYPSLSPEWLAEYSARVSGIVRQLRDAKKPTIWVGLPPMEAPKFGQTMIQVNEMDRLAAFGGGAEFLDIYEKFANEDGKYTARGPDLNGTQVRMRKDDGIHFSTAGADKLAFYLSQSLKNYYRGGGRVGIEVADALAGTDAQMMLRPPYQGLGQMKLLELAGAVMPLSNVTRRAAELVTAETRGRGRGGVRHEQAGRCAGGPGRRVLGGQGAGGGKAGGAVSLELSLYQTTTIFEPVGDLAGGGDGLDAGEVGDVAGAAVGVVAVGTGPVEAAEEAVFGVHGGECGLDGGAGAGAVDQVRQQDVAVIVHGPQRVTDVPDDLLADEISAAEIAVAIEPVALAEGEIVSARTARGGLSAAADIGGGLGGDDEGFEVGHRFAQRMNET